MTSTYLESDKMKKNGFISNNIATLFLKKKYIGWRFTFLCMHSVRNYQRQCSYEGVSKSSCTNAITF